MSIFVQSFIAFSFLLTIAWFAGKVSGKQREKLAKEKLEEELKELLREKESIYERIDVLKLESEEALRKAEESCAEKVTSESIRNLVNEKLDDRERYIETLESKIASIERVVGSLKHENNSLKNKLSHEKVLKNEAVVESESFRNKVRELKSQPDEHKRRCEAYEALAEAYKNQRDEYFKKLQSSVQQTKLGADKGEIQERYDNLLRQNDIYKKRIEELLRSSAQSTRIDVDNSEIQEKYNNLLRQSSIYRKRVEELLSKGKLLRSKIKEHEEKSSIAESSMVKSQHVIKDMELRLQKFEEVHGELENQYSLKNLECLDLRDTVSRLEKENKNFEEQEKDLVGLKRFLSEKESCLIEKDLQIKEMLARFKDNNEASDLEVEARDRKINKLSNQVEVLELRLDETRHEINKALADAENKKRELENCRARNHCLQAELRKSAIQDGKLAPYGGEAKGGFLAIRPLSSVDRQEVTQESVIFDLPPEENEFEKDRFDGCDVEIESFFVEEHTPISRVSKDRTHEADLDSLVEPPLLDMDNEEQDDEPPLFEISDEDYASEDFIDETIDEYPVADVDYELQSDDADHRQVDFVDEDLEDEWLEVEEDLENDVNKLTGYMRACQRASEFIWRFDWPESYLHPLAEILNTRGYGSILTHLQAYAEKGMGPEEFMLAVELRKFWSSNRFLWLDFGHFGNRHSYTKAVLSWAQCLEIIHGFTEPFDSVPSFEEIEDFVLQLFDSWYSRNSIREAYTNFIYFLVSTIDSLDRQVGPMQQISWVSKDEYLESLYPNDPYDIFGHQEKEFYLYISSDNNS